MTGGKCSSCNAIVPAGTVVCPLCRKTSPGPVKKGVFYAILVLLMVGTIELALRAYFATQMGPSVFFYGTRFHRRDLTGPVERSPIERSLYHRRLRGSDDEYHNVRQHDFVAARYSKYSPHEERYTYDADTGEIFRVTINGRGFRGPDFDEAKQPGTTRVVTLGASSTFGYHDPDDGTYPALLQRVLAERCPEGPPYEVINLGIPHLRSDEILSLFLTEGLSLAPDVVTFYEAINDSSPDGEGGDAAQPNKRQRPLNIVARWMRDHFIIGFLVDETLSRRQHYAADEVEALAQGKPEHFVENLARIHQECQRRGILFLVGKQQARSMLVPREDIAGMTYADEVALVRSKLAEQGYVDKAALSFLTHDRVNAAVDRWAHANDVPFVDVVAALDRHRDVLVSWVHVNPRGNRMIAEAFAGEIARRTCAPAGANMAKRPLVGTDGG